MNCFIFRSALIMAFGMLCLSRVQAQWVCALKNVVESGHNVEWLLQYQGEVVNTRKVTAEIRMRIPGRYQDVYRKSVELDIGSNKSFQVPLNLRVDSYDYDVEVYDPLTGESQILKPEEPFLVNSPSGIRSSDIFLSIYPRAEQGFLSPILSPNLPPGVDTIYYYLAIKSDRSFSATSEAFFYENVNKNDNSRGDILVYASLQGSRKQLVLEKGERTVLSGKFPTSALKEGAYFVEITIGLRQDNPIQETAYFTIGSDLQKWIYDNLDNAIRMMKYILPEASLDELLDSPTAEARQIEFKRAWEDLYQKDTQEEMTQYYARILEADKLFSQDGGWQSDRGKTFMLYGIPSKIEEIQLKGEPCIRWLYPKWSLVFLFVKRNQTYQLVE